jgi:hypothetical protein
VIQVTRRCMRLDDHTPHLWFAKHWFSYEVRDEYGNLMHPAYWCKGKVLIEGGSR